MLQLPNVTLLTMDTIYHELATMSIQQCIDQAEFGDILCFSDKSIWPTYRHIKTFAGILECQEFLWYGVPWRDLKTSHALYIHWDSWIADPTMWHDEYLQYDYIGAPWWFHDGLNVGNGGFSLRSKRLMQFLAEHCGNYPMVHPEDNNLCRVYRPQLETHGFKWAPEKLAHDFAFEYNKPSEDSRHFGFHGSFHFGKVIGGEKAEEYLRSKRRNRRHGELDGQPTSL